MTLPWSAVIARLAEPLEVGSKSAAPGWSFAVGRGDRRRARDIERVTAAVLDVDGAEPGTFERVASRLAELGIRAALHATHSHRPDVERFRVIVPFVEPVPPAVLGAAMRQLSTLLDAEADPGSADPTHTWRVPCRAPGAPYAWCAIEGEPFEVDELPAEGGHKRVTGLAAPTAFPPCALPPPGSGRAPSDTRSLDRILLGLSPRLRRMIEEGPSVNDGYTRRDELTGAVVIDRSAADFALILGLVNNGATDDEIVSIFDAYPTSGRYWEKGAGYLTRSIRRARESALPLERVEVRVLRAFVNEIGDGELQVRIEVEPLNKAARVPRYVGISAPPRGSFERWDALFAAADLETPDASSYSEVERQARGLVGERLILELDARPERISNVRRILPAAREGEAV